MSALPSRRVRFGMQRAHMRNSISGRRHLRDAPRREGGGPNRHVRRGGHHRGGAAQEDLHPRQSRADAPLPESAPLGARPTLVSRPEDAGASRWNSADLTEDQSSIAPPHGETRLIQALPGLVIERIDLKNPVVLV